MSDKITKVTKSKIACDGGTSSSHPRVWLQIEPSKGEVVCPYCDAKFVLEGKGSAH